mmetsp:Transcript_2321/g.3292  ORF Transcript_2321/g.3292 Transcript_2321/m.3292 type:complete len:205 (-) Transcript_2321:133-747(-)|eukprot:CAMPEP_0171463212 /NCGR_PEP_ID=MMETSP0945-20130129/6961_1 /TAXON_ID=109269 /ORGANISM="Vaucheria litorea, Strain CCMP2940" /LENGTH=204 /DNA_ID=CAMNT_0011989935 /DNA_START=25 /DNA_END=639 /DNA_ORIENTATION=+
MTFKRVVVIDARAHLLGRLASVVAKELLSGQRVVLVRCEGINISGELFRNKLKWESFRRKRTNTNPKKGPIHFRSPADYTRRTIRGMIPHKTHRGALAMDRLKCCVGIPKPYDKIKRVVVPSALRVTHLRPGRKFTVLGELCQNAGWKYGDVVERLEAKRAVRASAYHNRKTAEERLRKKAVAKAEKKIAEQAKVLESFHYPVL